MSNKVHMEYFYMIKTNYKCTILTALLGTNHMSPSRFLEERNLIAM